MPKLLRKPVFPAKTGKKREKGVSKPGFSFRAPDDLATWLKEMKASGHDLTEVIIAALRVGRDAARGIGERWYEIEYLARRKAIEPGEMLAALALTALEAERAGVPAAKPPKK